MTWCIAHEQLSWMFKKENWTRQFMLNAELIFLLWQFKQIQEQKNFIWIFCCWTIENLFVRQNVYITINWNHCHGFVAELLLIRCFSLTICTHQHFWKKPKTWCRTTQMSNTNSIELICCSVICRQINSSSHARASSLLSIV